MIKLRPHQQEIIDWTDEKLQHLDPERFGLFFAPRVGKTYTIMELFNKYEIKKGLIIVPKKLKPQWAEEVENWGVGHVVMSKEEFKKHHRELEKFEAVAVDEVHHFSNIKSQLTKSLIWYFKRYDPKYRWLATGTPYRSNPMNIYALYVLLGKPISYWKFFNQFYTQVQMGHNMIPVLRTGTESLLESYIKDVGVTLSLSDIADVPEPILEVEEFEMTDEQEEAIKAIDESMHLSRFTKIHQIEQGFVYGDEYVEDQVFLNLKNDRILELVKKHDKIAISCRFTHQINLLKELLSFKNVYIVDGRTPDRLVVEKEVRQDEQCVVLLQASASEGMDLSSIDVMVFASLSYSHLDHVQMKNRLENQNISRQNTYHYLIAGNTADRAIYNRIEKNMDFHETLFTN